MDLACSVGVGRSKLMAKLASKAAKPRASRSGIEPGPGVVEVRAEDELAFLHPMPVRALWGIGPVTEKRLLALGVTTVGELAALSPEALERYLGTAVGPPPVRAVPGHRRPPGGPRAGGQVDRPRGDLLHRPLGPRRTCSAGSSGWSTPRPPPCVRPERAARTVTVKLRFGDFTQITRSHTLDGPVDATPAIAAVAAALLDSVDLVPGRPAPRA